MIDRAAQAWLTPALQRLARGLMRVGVGADAVTLAGFAIGLGAALVIAQGEPLWGLALIAASRLADGVDGALARLTRPTDRGAFLDVTLDFLFYASIPLAFAVAEPARNALPAALLLASFIGTGSSFLVYALMAERQGVTETHGLTKGLVYLGGLTEAGETLLCFALMCLWPAAFPALALGFAALCALTTVSRVWAGWRQFGGGGR